MEWDCRLTQPLAKRSRQSDQRPPHLGFFSTEAATTKKVTLKLCLRHCSSHQAWSGAQLSSIVIERAATLSSFQRQTSASPGLAGQEMSFTSKRGLSALPRVRSWLGADGS